jgi:hypothetical protein
MWFKHYIITVKYSGRRLQISMNIMVAQMIMTYVKLLHLNKYWNKVYVLCLHLHALASTSRCGVSDDPQV